MMRISFLCCFEMGGVGQSSALPLNDTERSEGQVKQEKTKGSRWDSIPRWVNVDPEGGVPNHYRISKHCELAFFTCAFHLPPSFRLRIEDEQRGDRLT